MGKLSLYDVNAVYKEEELLPVVALLAQQYTSFESTSVTYECANQLMQAAKYCISADLAAGNHRGSVMEAYRSGLKIVTEKTNELLQMFNRISPCFHDYGNRCLHDTVICGIPAFLQKYDVKYSPQDTILTMDYPILEDMGELCGVDAVYFYLSSIETEQQFLSKIPEDYMMRVCNNHPLVPWKDCIENVTETVLPDIFAHLYLKKRFSERSYSTNEYRRLYDLFQLEDVTRRESEIFDDLVDNYYDQDIRITNYLQKIAIEVVTRMRSAAKEGRLESILP